MLHPEVRRRGARHRALAVRRSGRFSVQLRGMRATMPPTVSLIAGVAGAVALFSSLADGAQDVPTLVEHPIESGQPPLYLDGDNWVATHSDVNATGPPSLPPPAAWGSPVPAKVPGDILTDLESAGGPDPYFNITWRDPEFIRTWNEGVWTYSTNFSSPAGAATQFLLVFDGIRMGAMISLNGQFLGNATDQFVRYTFDIDCSVLACGEKQNTLTVAFGHALAIETHGRYTYSQTIDWAPTMLTSGFPGDHTTFGFGIWKSVYLLPVRSAAISQLVPHTFYQGIYPTSRLSDSNHAGFEVRTLVELICPLKAGCSGTLTVQGDWPGAVKESSQVSSLPVGTSNVTVVLAAQQTKDVMLWHPHGHGAQPRYSITATFTPSAGPGEASPAVATRKIGFRTIALVTVNDTDASIASAAASQDGTGQLTMFFRVNGAPVYARGGNKIPMELLDGRMSAEGHYRLVKSAVEGRFPPALDSPQV
jgi:beta-mannosidase